MIALLIILGVLILICLIPVGAYVIYSADGPEVSVVAGPKKIKLIPKPVLTEEEKAAAEKKKQDKKAKKEEKAKKAEEKKKQAEEKKKKKDAGEEKPKKKAGIGGQIPMFKELLGVGLHAIGVLFRKLRMDLLVLHFTVGGKGEDPAAAAILYGRAWSAIAALTPVLEKFFRVKKWDLNADIDFSLEENIIYAEGKITFLIGDLLWLGIYHGVRALHVFLKHKLRRARKERLKARNNKAKEQSNSNKQVKGGKTHGTANQ